MNRMFTALIVLSVFAAPLIAQEEAKPKAQTIKFTAKSPVVGDQIVVGSKVKSKMVMNMSMGEMGEQEMNQGADAVVKKTVTILEVKGDKVTKFKVAYKEVKAVVTMEMPMLPEPNSEDPLAALDITGNTFFFTIAEDGVKVTDASKEPVGGEKAEKLISFETHDGKFISWEQATKKMLPKLTLTVGETITVPKEKALAFLPNRDMIGDISKFKFEMTLRATKKVFGVDCAVFDIVMSLDGEPKMPGGDMPGGMSASMSTKSTGSLTVGINNMWIYSNKMAGPIQMEASGEVQEGMVINIDGKGDASTDIMNVYSKAKAAEKQ